MKKFFTFVAAALCAMNMMAKDYTCNLNVNVSGMDMPCGETTVSVDKQDNGKYTLKLENFNLMGYIYVGTINVKDVDAIDYGTFSTIISTQQTIQIAAGTTEGVDAATWLGPQLGDVPILLKGELKGDKFNAVLNINMAKLGGMNVGVQLGDVTGLGQLPNSGLEYFHTASVSMGGNTATSDEPNNWHSFMSASSDNPALVYLAGYNPVTFISDDVRPGSEGKKSVLLTSIDMSFVIANGTMTTGRMNTGSTTATDTDKNFAWLDTSTTDVDANGDPFYAALTSKPDSIKFWAKFKQGTPNAEHPYATCSAIITDGTRFQEPAPTDVTYSNVIGEARYPKIATTDNQWKEINVPFAYKGTNLDPKAILVTFSTNADAGQGSTDSLYIDDISLVYNANLTGISYKGKKLNIDGDNIKDGDENLQIAGDFSANDFEITTDGAGAYVSVTLVPEMDAYGNPTGSGLTNGYITVTSADLKTANVYFMDIQDPTATGIHAPQTVTKPAGVQAIYNMAGQQVSSMQKGQVYILKYYNGQTKKMIKK